MIKYQSDIKISLHQTMLEEFQEYIFIIRILLKIDQS